MKYVGIIAAIDEEINSIKGLIKNIKIKNIYELELIEGKINNKDVVVVKSGVGKVNAARTTQILINHYNTEYIINVGTAGGLNDKIEIGDIVIADKLVQHDFDLTAAGKEKGYISKIGRYFYTDKKLVEKAKNVMENMDDKFNKHIGTIATGDVFVQDINIKNDIKKEFNADCTEMEGAAIAQVCSLNKIPFIVIRAISDKPNGKNAVDFEKYLEMACTRYVKFIDIFIK